MISGTNITLKNNIIMNVRAGAGSYDNISNVIISSSNNIFYNITSGTSGGMFGELDGANWFNWSEWRSLGFDVNSWYVNPLLETNYHLQSNSPAINNGTDLSAFFTTDFNGISRPQGSAWDIGAYEYH